MFEEALEIKISAFGRVHPSVANSNWNWAESLQRAGRVSDAESKWKTACEIYKASLGARHPTYLACLNWWKN